MERAEVTIETPVTAAGVTLIPVVKVSLNHWCGRGGISFFGFKQPLGVVVVSMSEKAAFGMAGEEIPLDQFMQEVPGLKEILEGMR